MKKFNEKTKELKNLVTDYANPKLSIVIPAYFEGKNLKYLYDELLKTLNNINLIWELIIVDDGSKDDTWKEILALNKKDPRVKGLRFSRNFGHQYALFAGLNYASGKAIITMDGDMQHPPNVIPKLIAEWEKGFKIVNTVRIDHKNTKFSKRITSKWFYKVFSFLSEVKLEAGKADFRLLDEQVVKEFLKLNESGLFLRGLVEWFGFNSTDVKFQSQERLYGKTKYSLKQMLKFAWTGTISFSIKPLRIGILLGIITSGFAFIQLLLALYDHFVLDITVPGWTTLVVITTFLFGILFIILGIIGEYIGRILIETRNRQKFIISEFIGIQDNFINNINK